MRIAQICTNAMSGSVGRIAQNLADYINDSGNDCVIFFSRGKDSESNRVNRFGGKLGVYSHAILARLFDSDGLHSRKDTENLIRCLDRYSPDIIHLHCLHGYYLNYPLLFEYLKSKKVIWTMHDCWAFTGHCAFYDFCGCKKWISGCKSCPQKREYPKSLLFDRSKRNYSKKKTYFTLPDSKNMILVTPSEWLKREISKSFLRDYPTYVINNDVDHSVFYLNTNNAIEKRILGVANVWDRRKGLKDFIELSKDLPDDYHIFIVGATDEQIKELRKYDIKAVKKTSNQKELAELYRTSTILFNPTYEDNYPTVNVEAAACGLPIVTYETGGSPEIVRETGMGIIVEKKDYQAVVNYLDIAYSRAFKYRQQTEDMGKKYLQLYDKLNDRAELK